MKSILRKLLSPLLGYFDSGEGAYSYKNSHRTILIVVGCLFLFLAISVIAAGIAFSQMGAVFPGLIFLSVAFTCLAVGSFGSDRAVSRIWGSK
ncbi:MAG: hypothetical protein JKY67_05310 [Pseudomonadales bacterium]|nr:hypothetical protein [Pseudomonadales bacterium]